MDAQTSTASSSTIAPESLADGLAQRKKSAAPATNDVKTGDKPETKSPEFAHSFPIHTKSAASILSTDNTEGLSLRGFGNVGRTLCLTTRSLTK